MNKEDSAVPVRALPISCFGCDSNVSHVAYAGQSLGKKGNGMRKNSLLSQPRHLIKEKVIDTASSTLNTTTMHTLLTHFDNTF